MDGAIYAQERGSKSDVQMQVVMLEMHHLLMKNYNYLIIDLENNSAVVVDPAWQIEKIEIALLESQAELHGVLLTHSHFDHVNLAKLVASHHNCPIWMSEHEINFSGFRDRHLNAIEEKPWTVKGLKINPILTPGHTPGCICYLIGENVFTGDVLFYEGCGICPDEAAAEKMFFSLQYLKSRLSADIRVFPGHSYGKPPGQEFSKLLAENIYLQFVDKEMFVKFRLRSDFNKSKILDFK